MEAPTAVQESPPPYGEYVPGGYLKRSCEDYDRSLCLIPRDVIDFILATQPKEWQRLKEHHGAEVRERFLDAIVREIDRRGALDVLRNGVKDSGCKFKLAYFPAGERAERRVATAACRPISSRWCASSITAKSTRRASTLASF